MQEYILPRSLSLVGDPYIEDSRGPTIIGYMDSRLAKPPLPLQAKYSKVQSHASENVLPWRNWDKGVTWQGMVSRDIHSRPLVSIL